MIATIGKYQIRKRLGGGGFGEVYLADDASIDRQVAIKVFSPKDENIVSLATSATSEGFNNLRQRFISEAKILASLEHEDAIVNIIEFGELDDGSPWYAMPYLPQSLAQLVGKDIFDKRALEDLPENEHPKALPLEQSLSILQQVLQGLAAAHEKGLIHRDIKPANILLSSTGKVRIADFGIAKAPDSGHSTVSQLGMGSRNYMSPEQRESAKHVDARADVYSTGLLAYRMLTGLLPKGRFADPNVHVPHLNEAINNAILKAINEDADDRFNNAAQMLAAIDIGLQEQNTNTPTTEQTGTWVGESANTDFKAQYKPITDSIAQALRTNGEITKQDNVNLTAFAELADLEPGELDTLIAQVTEQVSKADTMQAGLIAWVAKLNKQIEKHEDLDESQQQALLQVGISTTGKSQEELQHIIDTKLAAVTKIAGAHNSSITQATKQTSVTNAGNADKTSSKRKSSGKWATVVAIIIFLAGGSYFGYEYIEEQEAKKLAQLEQVQKQQQQQDQARQAAQAKQANEQSQVVRIKQAQDYLLRLGYQVSETGTLDTRTSKAIETFEIAQSLLVTGEVDDVLLTNLQTLFDEQDTQAWTKAKQINSSQAYTSYLEAFKKGAYIAPAQTALANALKKEKQIKAEALAKQEDKGAWDKASESNSISAYQAYLNTQRTGQYRQQAKSLINAIKVDNSKVALNINVSPKDATIQILNIEEKFRQGIRLLPGEYKVRIQKVGYVMQSDLIKLSIESTNYHYSLKKDLPKPIKNLISGMQSIPAGSFIMGCSKDDSMCSKNEEPRHLVTVNSFKLMEHEVTFAMWDLCVNGGGCSHYPNDEGWGRGNHPVTDVSYRDITEQFIPWLNRTTDKTFRLPTEAEWEYAARAGSLARFSWGNNISCSQARYGRRPEGECSSNYDGTVAVKSYTANAFGLYDMLGNVWEWTQDCHNESYKGAPTNSNAWLKGDCSRRLLRGGSWSYTPEYLSASRRLRDGVSSRSGSAGFRLAKD